MSDTTKSFLLILGTDLLVGFHSPRGWEIGLELILRHFGFPENQDFIYLFVVEFDNFRENKDFTEPDPVIGYPEDSIN